MAFLTSGGSTVTSANIVDGEIVNADVSPTAAIAQTKLAGTSNGNTDVIACETSSSVPYSLTTVANQRVIVIVSGRILMNAGPTQDTINLQYNGVTKSSVTVGYSTTSASSFMPFTLMYSEVPGAATANIGLTTTTYTPADVDVTVIKLK